MPPPAKRKRLPPKPKSSSATSQKNGAGFGPAPPAGDKLIRWCKQHILQWEDVSDDFDPLNDQFDWVIFITNAKSLGFTVSDDSELTRDKKLAEIKSVYSQWYEC